MDRKAPAYQWYPKDYETDEAVKLMTYEQEGIYRRLLDHQALHGGIPSDPEQIARLVPKVTPRRFLSLWPGMASKFSDAGGRLVNQKLERVKADTAAFKAGKSNGGKASAEVRAAKHGTAQPQQPPNNSPNNSPNRPPNSARTERSTAPEPATATASATALDPPERSPGDLARATRGVAQGLTLHRGGHQRHAWCSERICVPDFTHDRLCRQLGRPDADTWLKDWYLRVIERIGYAPIGEKPEDFWPREFAVEFPPSAGASKLTAALAKASEW